MSFGHQGCLVTANPFQHTKDNSSEAASGLSPARVSHRKFGKFRAALRYNHHKNNQTNCFVKFFLEIFSL
jgi:hypothetical protein